MRINRFYEYPSIMFNHFDYKKHKILDLMSSNNFNKNKKISLTIRYRPEDDYTLGIY